jgi:hypothetical protein
MKRATKLEIEALEGRTLLSAAGYLPGNPVPAADGGRYALAADPGGSTVYLQHSHPVTESVYQLMIGPETKVDPNTDVSPLKREFVTVQVPDWFTPLEVPAAHDALALSVSGRDVDVFFQSGMQVFDLHSGNDGHAFDPPKVVADLSPALPPAPAAPTPAPVPVVPTVDGVKYDGPRVAAPGVVAVAAVDAAGEVHAAEAVRQEDGTWLAFALSVPQSEQHPEHWYADPWSYAS